MCEQCPDTGCEGAILPWPPPKKPGGKQFTSGEKIRQCQEHSKTREIQEIKSLVLLYSAKVSLMANESLRGFSLGSSVEFLKWLIFHLRQNETKKPCNFKHCGLR